MTRRRFSQAWPMAAAYTCLIVYASLYPFTDWRSQGISPWAFVNAPWPRYWTGFDVISNLLGYIPLGLLLAVAAARTGWLRWSGWLGWLVPMLLSLVLEAAQTYLPQRVPSYVDWLLNSLGAGLGAWLAFLLVRWRVLGSWEQFSQHWLVPDTLGGVWVLLLWPLAVLYPTPVPFGLGHIWQRLGAVLSQYLQGTPFFDWLPVAEVSPPLSLLMQATLAGLCVWAPLLLAYALLRHKVQRVLGLLVFAVLVLVAGTLSAALTYGPEHAGVWLTPPVEFGLLAAVMLSLLSLPLAHRTCAVFSLLAWGFALGVLNRAPDTAYFAQSLELWEQGRFIRFHGLSQWLGWLWPYLALWVAVQLALRRATPTTTIAAHE